MEVLVASVIGAFVALVAVGTLKAISAGAEIVDSHIDTAAELRFASKTIAGDLMNLYRDKDIKNTKFVGTAQEAAGRIVSGLTFYTVGRIKARAGQPEGDVYEVEYYLATDQEKSALMRRLWPNPDKEEATQPGGILTAIAENIDTFEARFFDGIQWLSEWPEQPESVPQLVEITIAARRQIGNRDQMRTNSRPQTDAGIIRQSFIVNFAGSKGAETGAFEDDEKSETVKEESSNNNER